MRKEASNRRYLLVRKMQRISLFVTLCIMAVITLYPLFFMFVTSLKSNIGYLMNRLCLPKEIYIENYKNMLLSFNVLIYLRNSFICSGTAVLTTVFLSSLAAYIFTKKPFRGSKHIFTLVIFSMMISSQILIVPLYQIFSKMGLINNFLSLIIAYTALGLPYSIYLLSAHFRDIPDSIIEAAKIDGAGFYMTFFNIVLPIASTSIVTISILNFVWNWNELLMSMLMLSKTSVKTMSAAIATITGRFTSNIPLQMSMLIMNILPIIILYLIFQKYLVLGLSTGSNK